MEPSSASPHGGTPAAERSPSQLLSGRQSTACSPMRAVSKAAERDRPRGHEPAVLCEKSRMLLWWIADLKRNSDSSSKEKQLRLESGQHPVAINPVLSLTASPRSHVWGSPLRLGARPAPARMCWHRSHDRRFVTISHQPGLPFARYPGFHCRQCATPLWFYLQAHGHDHHDTLPVRRYHHSWSQGATTPTLYPISPFSSIQRILGSWITGSLNLPRFISKPCMSLDKGPRV